MKLPAFQTLKLEEPEAGLLVVTLNRPEVRNALNTQMGRELRELFVPLKFTPGELRCIVVTGSGDKAFCSGGDLKERQGMSDDAWRLQHAIFEEGYYAVMDCAVPVIAAVNGAAFGGGCELALACDFIFASSEAKFALTEVTIGIMPGCGGTQNMPRAMGERRAKQLILTGAPFTAQQACDWGMVNEVHAPGELMGATMAVARRIAANAPISVRQAKRSIHAGLQTDLSSGLVFEVQAYERMISTDDRREGINAFNEKRKPVFTGR
ncbi:MAG: enoyl-CoA hydratase [Betaproteobacteria bacterium]|nr:enoyl-CoA hydratase [Betaproteobacteria bacterium]